MKQFSFIVEFTCLDDKDTFIVREPRTGAIVNISNNVDDFRTFIEQSVCRLKNASENETKD